MKNFIKKAGFVLGCSLLPIIVFGITIYIVLTKSTDYKYELESNRDFDNKYINNFQSLGSMVAFGDKGINVTPVDAYIESGMVIVKSKIENKTGVNLKLKNFGIVTGNFTKNIFYTDYDEDTVLNNGDSKEVEFEVGAYDIMNTSDDFPTNMVFTLGAYNASNNNYNEYNLDFTIAWKYASP